MNIIRLNTTADQGTIINDIDSALWVERYFDAGEFQIKGDNPDYLLSALPIDSLVTHSDTREIMMVETHEVEDDEEDGPSVTISGRSYVHVMMENRIVTMNGGIPPTYGNLGIPGRGYLLSGGSNWNYARILMRNYLQNHIEDPSQELANIEIRSTISTPDSALKVYLFDQLPTLMSAVTELLEGQSIGIKTERPGSDHSTIDFIIHKGIDRSETVQFSFFLGDIKKARYLWSSSGYKNDGFVSAGGATFRMPSSSYNRQFSRVGVINASDLTYEFSDPPTSLELTAASQQLIARGHQGLAKMKRQKMVDAEIVDNPRHIFGQDFGIGDIVKVIGNYGVTERMRVTEFATTLDENGTTSHPTLSEL